MDISNTYTVQSYRVSCRFQSIAINISLSPNSFLLTNWLLKIKFTVH